MKRIPLVLVAAMFLFLAFTTVVFAQDKGTRAMLQVENTDNFIESQIERAANEAENLLSRYQTRLVQGTDIASEQKLAEHIKTLENVLNILSNQSGDSEGISKKILNLGNGLDKIQNAIARKNIESGGFICNYNISKPVDKKTILLINKINKAEGKLNSGSVKNEEEDRLYINFTAEMDRIINQLVDIVNLRTKILINNWERQGVLIESQWMETEIGNRVILIDPCRVRGF